MSGWESRSNSYRHPGSQQSDIESAPSAIGTVPNSYSGFDVFKVPSSTPSKIKVILQLSFFCIIDIFDVSFFMCRGSFRN